MLKLNLKTAALATAPIAPAATLKPLIRSSNLNFFINKKPKISFKFTYWYSYQIYSVTEKDSAFIIEAE